MSMKKDCLKKTGSIIWVCYSLTKLGVQDGMKFMSLSHLSLALGTPLGRTDPSLLSPSFLILPPSFLYILPHGTAL